MKKLEEAKNELEAKYGIRVLPVQADVCAGTDNEATVQNVVNQAVDTFGGIQVLVNNAQASASGVQLAMPDFQYLSGETLTLEGGMGLRP